MKRQIALTLLSILTLSVGTLSVSAAPNKAKPAACRSQQDCEKAARQFYDARKTIKLNVTKGSVITEPDGRKFTVAKNTGFTFVGFLQLTVNGSGSIKKSFPNGEFGGLVTFDGTGTIQYNDSGQVVFEGKGDGLKLTADQVTAVVLLDNTFATVTNCKFVDAYRNSIVSARDCSNVSAYTEAKVKVERCKKATRYDNAELTEVKTEAQ